jgi:hypothetical protein
MIFVNKSSFYFFLWFAFIFWALNLSITNRQKMTNSTIVSLKCFVTDSFIVLGSSIKTEIQSQNKYDYFYKSWKILDSLCVNVDPSWRIVIDVYRVYEPLPYLFKCLPSGGYCYIPVALGIAHWYTDVLSPIHVTDRMT